MDDPSITRRRALQTMGVLTATSALSPRCAAAYEPKMNQPIATMPLLKRLDQIDAKLKRETIEGEGLFAVGLGLHKTMENGGYSSTPKNTLAFAWPGGDGVHYSVLTSEEKVLENSPVVMTVPASGEANFANLIVGETLLGFLRFGLIRGYFPMEQLVYSKDEALAAFSDPNWRPAKDSSVATELAVSQRTKQILQVLASELKITHRGYSATEFQALQDRFMPKLEFKPQTPGFD